jgi:hypothetical protein
MLTSTALKRDLSFALALSLLAPVAASAETPAKPSASVAAIGWANADDKDRSIAWLNLHFTDGESAGIESLLEQAGSHNEPFAVPVGDKRLPSRYQVGGKSTIISKRRQIKVSFESFDVAFQEGNYFIGGKARSERPGTEDGLLVAGPVSPGAKLAVPRGKSLPAKEAAKVLAAVLATATEDALVVLETSPLLTRDLQVIDARAPAGSRIVLASQINQDRKNGYPGKWTVGLFLLAKDGTLTSLHGPGLQSGSSGYTLTWRTDIDGDGVDELIEETEWAEGSTSLALLRWDGKKYYSTRI